MNKMVPTPGPRLSAETIHASTVEKDGRAVLITGPSGSGKSDLTLRLLDREFSRLGTLENFVDEHCTTADQI